MPFTCLGIVSQHVPDGADETKGRLSFGYMDIKYLTLHAKTF